RAKCFSESTNSLCVLADIHAGHTRANFDCRLHAPRRITEFWSEFSYRFGIWEAALRFLER
ncbi:hypothetical protein NDU88_008353, partial [Pleurodeles waltl]